MREIRRLTGPAIAKFRDYLDAVSSGHSSPFPSQMIGDDAWAEKIGDITDSEAPDADCIDLTNRFSMARDLHRILSGSTLTRTEWLQPEMWTWFAVVYFRRICPEKDGKWRPGDTARWIPLMTWRRYYRHLLAGPFRVYSLHEHHPDLVRGILNGEAAVPGEAFEQMASRLEVVQSEGIMRGFQELYWDPAKMDLKRGSRGKVQGGIRRYADLVNQLTLTWDMNRVGADELMTLLPVEFDRFRVTAQS